MTRTLISLLAASTLIGGAALAQPAPPPPPGHDHGMGEHGMGERGMGEHRPDPDKLAARLRTALQLRPDQDGALKTFVASMQPPAEDMHARMKAGHEAMERATTPEKLDRMIARAREHLARLEQHTAAVKAFYATLNPSQQKAFDLFAAAHMRGMGPGHGRGPMGHPGQD